MVAAFLMRRSVDTLSHVQHVRFAQRPLIILCAGSQHGATNRAARQCCSTTSHIITHTAGTPRRRAHVAGNILFLVACANKLSACAEITRMHVILHVCSIAYIFRFDPTLSTECHQVVAYHTRRIVRMLMFFSNTLCCYTSCGNTGVPPRTSTRDGQGETAFAFVGIHHPAYVHNVLAADDARWLHCCTIRSATIGIILVYTIILILTI